MLLSSSKDIEHRHECFTHGGIIDSWWTDDCSIWLVSSQAERLQDTKKALCDDFLLNFCHLNGSIRQN